MFRGVRLSLLAVLCLPLIAFGQSPKMSDRDRLHKLFADDWEWRLREFPESATYLGYPGHNDRWTDWSLAAIAQRKQHPKEVMRTLKSIERGRLSDADKLNYDLFKRNVQEDIDGQRFPAEYMPINQLSGVQVDVANVLSLMPAFTAQDYTDILARLSGVPVLIEQTIALLNKGLESNVTPPRITLRDVPQQVLNQIVDDPLQSPLMRVFDKMPESLAPAQRDTLQKRAMKALAGKAIPAFRKLHEFLVTTYIPKSRESIALADLKDGEAWYQFNVRQSTTTKLSPKEIYEIGLAEVQRIHEEMGLIIDDLGFRGSFEEFIEFLRNDPQFYFKDAERLLTAYRDICKRADPELAKLFGKLPRLPYGVIPVPAYSEQSQTTAYYQPGSLAAGRPGYFYANTYALNTRPIWEMEALSLHEAVPGHHLQIALAQELEGVPEFRKHAGYTAFVEGWGLYAEGLGEEMGFYTDPYSKFGQLTYQMWRAVRLVVDTGMHALGWSRQEAIDFFKQNSSKPEHDIVVEIDRYIVWPGQALAYKIGELKIKALRSFAEKELGTSFNLRAFHDAVLGSGALPLDVFEARLQAWVAQQKRIENTARK